MASLALTGASLWRAMRCEIDLAGCASCTTRLCGALCGSGRPPRGGRRRSFVGGDRLLVANGRCWRRRGSAPRRRRRARATNTALAATRRHPRGSVRGQHDTRRHTATSAGPKAADPDRCRSRPVCSTHMEERESRSAQALQSKYCPKEHGTDRISGRSRGAVALPSCKCT